MTETTCWADPLSRAERHVLRKKLARACKRSYEARKGLARPGSFDLAFGVVAVSAECSDLHLDVTERAAWPPPGDEGTGKLTTLRADLRAAGWSAEVVRLSDEDRAEMVRDYGIEGA